MASFHQFALRHAPIRPINTTKWLQRRWARVHDVRFVTQQASERITDRYRHKLEEKARQQGLKDAEQLKEAYKDKIQRLRKQALVPGANGASNSGQPSQHAQGSGSPWPTPPPPPQPQAEGKQKTTSSSKPPPGVKTLSSYLDIEKTMDLPKKEVEAIWRLRHAHNQNSLCAAIPTDVFQSIYRTARRHPQFILPGLPRDQATADRTGEGAPIHFLQWTFPAPDTVTVLFTHLAEYKLRGEHSQPHTTLTHHMELAGPKGLVLSQGSIVADRGVSVEEGKWLVLCMQKFYNTQTVEEIEQQANETQLGKDLRKARRKLIEQFNSGDTSFKIEELLEQAERMG